MYIIIVGAGEVGCYVARILIAEGHEVAIIDSDPSIVRRLDGSLNALVVEGSGVDPRSLVQAGLPQADLLLAVTSIDEVNLIACLTARKQGPPTLRTVARVRWSWQAAGDPGLQASDLALDELVSAQRAVAHEALAALRFVGVGEVRELAGGKVALVSLPLAADSPLVHDTLADLRLDFASDFLVVAVQGPEGVRIPSGMDRMRPSERALILTLPANLTELAILTGQPFSPVRRVLLVGGGDTGLAIARDLARLKLATTLIEADPARSEYLAHQLPDATIIHGDGTDPDLLRRRIQTDQIDAIVVLLRNAEAAALVGIFAKSLGARKAIIRCDKPGYQDLVYRLGIDGVLSPKYAVINAILRHIRRGDVASTQLLGDHAAEIIALRVPARPANPAIHSQPLSDIGIPRGALIGAIVRDDQAFIPTGATRLQPHDELLVVSTPHTIPLIERLLAPDNKAP